MSLDVLIGDKPHLSITQIMKIMTISPVFFIISWLLLPWQPPLKLAQLHMNELPQVIALI